MALSVPAEEPSTASIAAVSNRSKRAPYSITSSAATIRDVGTVKCSKVAVLRFITNWNFTGA
jgi:hypothetical protein